MIRRRILAAFVALLAGSATARADELFDNFKAICVSTDAIATDALAVADKLGWMPLPQQMLDGVAKTSLQLHDPQGRLRSSAAGLKILFTAVGALPSVPDMNGHFCAVGALAGELPDLKSQASSFAMVPEQMSGADTIYLWRDENGAHAPVNLGDLKTADAAAAVRFLMIRRDEKMSLILFGIVSKSS